MMPVEKPLQEMISQISIRNLNFYYGKAIALKGINLEVYKGKVTAFIGPVAENRPCCAPSTGCTTFIPDSMLTAN